VSENKNEGLPSSVKRLANNPRVWQTEGHAKPIMTADTCAAQQNCQVLQSKLHFETLQH